MTPEERRMLEQTYAQVQENAEMLRGIQRRGRIGAAFKVLYWGVIIAASFGAYWLIQPYVDTYKEAMGQVQELYK